MSEHKVTQYIVNEAPSCPGAPTLIDSPVLGDQEQGISDSRRFEALTVNPTVQTVKLPARMAEFP